MQNQNTTTDQRINDLRAEIDRLNAARAVEVKRVTRADRERQAALLSAAGLTVERRANSRFFNLLDEGGELIAVCVYKKGAVSAGCAIAAARTAAAVRDVAAA